jgi:hypothetical protein
MSRLLAGALAVAAISVAAIVWEVQDSAGPELVAPAGRASVANVARTASGSEPDDVPQGWVNTALERPLFREDRRAVRASGEVARSNNEPLRLTGVITGPFGNRAIFLAAGSTKPIVAEQNAQLNGFVVRSIEPGKAVVVEPDGTERTLTPSFANRDQTAQPGR